MKKRSCIDIDQLIEDLFNEFPKRSEDGLDTPSERKTKFNLPCIVMQHQLYAYFDNRTFVDKRVEDLVRNGKLRAIRMGRTEDETALVQIEQYLEHCRMAAEATKASIQTVNKFLQVVKSHGEVCFSKEFLEGAHFSTKQISELIQAGVLTLRKIVGSYWLSIPNVGEFIKHLENGRKQLVLTVRKTKFKQIHRTELSERKIAKSKLPIKYLIDDIIGLDLVEKMDSTTGDVLRLND